MRVEICDIAEIAQESCSRAIVIILAINAKASQHSRKGMKEAEGLMRDFGCMDPVAFQTSELQPASTVNNRIVS